MDGARLQAPVRHWAQIGEETFVAGIWLLYAVFRVAGRLPFRLGLDNLLISRMHARLFLGMLVRAPMLLWRKVAPR